MNQTADLELSIHRQDQQSYAVEFRYTDSDPDNQTDVRLGAKQQVLITIGFPALYDLMLTGDFLQYGKTLTQSFFADEALRTAFAQVRATTQRAEATLRIRLAVGPSAVELYALRWETLLDPQSGQSLATDHTVYFSRYLSSLDWRPVRLRARGELRMLAAIAAPSGLEQYKLASVDREKELATIKSSIGEIKLQALEHGTLNDIIAALTDSLVDILYLVAHGTLAENNEPILWLEDEQGQIQRVSGNELVGRLRELENRPRLVVLVSCQSAGGSGDVLSALGPRLAEVGIPAVLAMQGNIRMETVAKFMPVFFDELQKDGRIDRALNVARGQIRDQPDWWMPVLFMRLKSGRLWYTPGFSLQDENSIVRAGAAKALGQISDAQAVPALLHSLRDIDWAVRNEAVPALGQIGDAQSILALFQASQDSDEWKRKAAVEALGQVTNRLAVLEVQALPLNDPLLPEAKRAKQEKRKR